LNYLALFVGGGGGGHNRRASIRSSIRSSTADLSAALKAFEMANNIDGVPMETNSGNGSVISSVPMVRRSGMVTPNLLTLDENRNDEMVMSNPALEEAMKGIAGLMYLIFEVK
jgi:hypothetical protein